MKENPNQKFAINIYIHTGGKGKSVDLVRGNSGWFAEDKNVTSYSGKTLKALTW